MNRKRSRGFSLVEIIVAMMIIGITAVVALEFYRLCLKRFVGAARLNLEASDYSRDKMESIYFVSPTNLGDTTFTLTETLPAAVPGAPAELKDSHAGKQSYTVTPTTRGYKVVSTSVDWE
jgi:prepilin-type N-terminal cleavage/methylation domain-containing protein